jgi:hypothetical protein
MLLCFSAGFSQRGRKAQGMSLFAIDASGMRYAQENA